MQKYIVRRDERVIMKLKQSLIEIVPYTPKLNPCEKLIRAVKSYLTKLQTEGRKALKTLKYQNLGWWVSSWLYRHMIM